MLIAAKKQPDSYDESESESIDGRIFEGKCKSKHYQQLSFN